MAAKMATDESAAVRREVALTLRDVPAPTKRAAAREDRAAVRWQGPRLSRSLRPRLPGQGSGGLRRGRQGDGRARRRNGATPSPGIAWRLHPAEAVHDFKTRALVRASSPRSSASSCSPRSPSCRAATPPPAMIELANTKDFPLQELAKWWLFNRKGNDWQGYDVDASMKALGLYDPDKVKLVGVEMPPAVKDAPALPPVAEIAKLQGRREARPGRGGGLLRLPPHRRGRHRVRPRPHHLRQAADRPKSSSTPSRSPPRRSRTASKAAK